MVEARSGGGGGLGGGTNGGSGGGGNDPFRNFFNGGSKWSLSTMFEMKDVSDKTRAHLTRVYTTLATASGTCAVGMYLNATFVLHGFIAMILYCMGMAYCIFQVSNPSNSENRQIMWMLGVAFSMGLLAGPGINHFAEVKPELLMQAVLYAMGAFGSFSAVSLFSQRRSFLFLGSIISTMMSAMLIYSLVGWLMGSAFGIGYLMCALFITCLWIIFDTQVIVEEAERGHRNVASHTLKLFLDLFDLFMQILRILNELDEKKKKDKK